jgi:hypothetical protein
MIRVVLLFVMAISQAQPLAAACLCDQHDAAMPASCMGEPADHQDFPDSHSAPADHHCAAMAGCSMVAPAILSRAATTTATVGTIQAQLITPTRAPHAVVQAPPFHPPKA